MKHGSKGVALEKIIFTVAVKVILKVKKSAQQRITNMKITLFVFFNCHGLVHY
jgi:hypothetical protein